MCFITAFTLAAVKCTGQSVQSAETDEVSNIVVLIVMVFTWGGGGGLVKIYIMGSRWEERVS